MNKNEFMDLISKCDTVVEESHKYVTDAMNSLLQKNEKVDTVKQYNEKQQQSQQ